MWLCVFLHPKKCTYLFKPTSHLHLFTSNKKQGFDTFFFLTNWISENFWSHREKETSHWHGQQFNQPIFTHIAGQTSSLVLLNYRIYDTLVQKCIYTHCSLVQQPRHQDSMVYSWPISTYNLARQGSLFSMSSSCFPAGRTVNPSEQYFPPCGEQQGSYMHWNTMHTQKMTHYKHTVCI